MKKILLFFLLAPFVAKSQSNQSLDTVHVKDITDRDGLYYHLDSDKPFTGIAINKYPNGIKRYEAKYEEGKQRDYSVWNRSGLQTEEVRYVDEAGSRILWDYLGDQKVEEEFILKAGIWESIRQTNYMHDGTKLFTILYENDRRLSETHWYPDGSKKEEKKWGNNDVNTARAQTYEAVEAKFSWKIWDHNGNEIIPGKTAPPDTVDMEEIEWKGGWTAFRKGSNKPFTGVITFEGVLDYRKGISWRIAPSTYHSTANLTFGKFNGPYTVWYEENGKKRAERNLKNETRAEIKEVGTYTQWYENGKKEYERNSRHETEWYENGQMKSKRSRKNGRTHGRQYYWYENGQKGLETMYFKGELIKGKEWDSEGNEINEVIQVIDEDKHKILAFAKDIVAILKRKNYEQLGNLFISSEKFLEFMMNQMEGKEITEEQIKNFFDELEQEKSIMLKDFENMFYRYELGEIERTTYAFRVIKEDDSEEIVEWPKSINYELEQESSIQAYVQILISHGDQSELLLIQAEPFFIDDKWHFVVGNKQTLTVH